ncbi:MAG: hypothetical protein FJZ05_00445 [Candidatus Nealsonbacteria bacterium]|nr:hypothetical protein [Candidatus Nealsonbacteria bacterium]
MIPIVTISSIPALILMLFISYRIYSSYRKTKSRTINYFLKVFLSFLVGGLLFLPNGTLIKNPEIINLIFNIYPFFFFLGTAYNVALTFEIIDKQILKKFSFAMIVIYGLIICIIPAMEWQAAPMYVSEPFVFWEDTRGPLFNALTGIGILLPLLWIVVFYLYNGLKSDDKYIRNKSLLMVGSFLFFLFGNITDYIFGADTNIFYISLYTAFWYIVAIVLLFLVVEYKKEKTFLKEEAVNNV